MILETASLTHPGLLRAANEDALGAYVPEDPALRETRGALFAVADGLGGHAAGEVASRTAVDTVIAEYYSPRAPWAVETALGRAFLAANQRVFHLAHGMPDLRGMLTTLTALILTPTGAFVAHAGDCRLYRLRATDLTLVTSDHSEVAELLRLRLITPEQARNHPRRNVLTRALGSQPGLRPDFVRLPVQPGDRLMLCSDGLWGELPAETIAELLRLPPLEACERLARAACDNGGHDNLSLHVIHVVELGTSPSPQPAGPAGRIARLLAGLRGA